MRHIALSIFLSGITFAAAPRNVAVQDPTAQQAVIEFDLASPNDLASCTVVVYSDAGRTIPVADSDTKISPNAQYCDRGSRNGDLSSIVSSGTHVQFIAGLRGTRKSATDGRLYSMSLSPLTPYFYTITAGSVPFTGQFVTGNITVGQTFPDRPLFDDSGTNFSGFQYPYLPDDESAPVIDPTTGIPIRRVPSIQRDMGGLKALSTTAIDVSGGKWTNLANCGSNNGSACSSNSAGPADYLFLPLPYFAAGSGSFGGWNPYNRVEDVVFSMYCGSSGSSQTLRVWLSRDSGRSAASSSFDVVCPSGQPALRATLSDTANGNPHPWFSQWNPVKEWIKSEIIPAHGTVNTTGTLVAVASGDYFITSVPAGSSILINGSYYQIASFTDSRHLTLTSSAGSQSNASYTMASTGLRIANITGTGTVSLSVGMNAAQVAANGFGAYNADNAPCNTNAIGVSTDASGGAIPATKGYLCSDSESGLYLYVPFNSDGSGRLEMRPLSRLTVSNNSHIDMSGDSAFVGVLNFGGWDASDALTFYALSNGGGGNRIFKGRYDTTISAACAGFQAFRAGTANGFNTQPPYNLAADCFHYTNLTPLSASPSMELVSQIRAAYATGLNRNGQQVGPPHPMMSDIGWMPYYYWLSVVGNNGCLMQGWAAQESFSVGSCFNLSTGVLSSLVDSFSTWPSIGAGSHGWNTFTAPGLNWTMNGAPPIFDSGNPNIPFNRPFEMAVSQVNLADYGAPPNWTSTTAIDASKMFGCPTFSDPKVSNYFGDYSGTKNCIQVRVTTPPCNHSAAPNAAGGGYDFSGGKSEAQAYPCGTPGFGVSSSNPDASNWSKLWDIFPGMWLWDKTRGDKFSEDFVVATAPAYNAANDITIWLLRTAKDKYFLPRAPHGSIACAEAPLGRANHSGNWSLSVWPPFACGFTFYWRDLNDPTGTQYWDNELNGHTVIGSGTADGTFTRVWANIGYYDSIESASAGVDPNGFINQKATQTAAFDPSFAGYGAYNYTQSYPNLTAASPVAEPNNRKLIDNRAINSYTGLPAENWTSSNCLTSSFILTPQTGTSQTYLLSDASGSVSGTDPHISVLTGWAGNHYLKDYSSPATGNVFGDGQTWGFCWAYKANECRTGSTPGQVYVSVPYAENPNGCMQANQNTMNIPVVLNMATVAGQTIQADPYVFDASQTLFRKLGFGFRAPGMQYGFQHTWGMPDGRAILGRIDWADGRFAGLYLGAIPPWPATTSKETNNYQSIEKTMAFSSASPKGRYLFGYAENGSTFAAPTANLYCASRKEICSTEGNPFAFLKSDQKTLTDCSTPGGCRIKIPVIRGRVVFIQEQRLSSNGSSVVANGPVQAIAVP